MPKQTGPSQKLSELNVKPELHQVAFPINL